MGQTLAHMTGGQNKGLGRWSYSDEKGSGRCKSCLNHVSDKPNTDCSAEEHYLAYRKQLERTRTRWPEYRRHHIDNNPTAYREHKWAQELKLKFGISAETYFTLLEKQGHKCAICESGMPARGHFKKFLVDHDHTTGRIRGLLCSRCNQAMGMFNDDPKLLLKVIEYLNGRKEPEGVYK